MKNTKNLLKKQMDSSVECDDLKESWDSHQPEDSEWANKGVAYVKCLRKTGHISEAVVVCERILKHIDEYDWHGVKNEYGWCLYFECVKSKDEESISEERIEKIIELIFWDESPLV